MPKNKTVVYPSHCIKCGKEIEPMSVQCNDCKSKPCHAYSCDTTLNVVHQHIYNKEWYCIMCAKNMNIDSARLGSKECFDLF